MSAKMKIENIHGYQNFTEKLNYLESSGCEERVFFLFTGDHDEQGNSWCPDCVQFDKLLQEYMARNNPEGILLRIYVGSRDAWKSPQCPFRTDQRLKISSVPTLIEWNTPKRLDGDSLQHLDTIKLMFEED